jgi:hypothetical protein
VSPPPQDCEADGDTSAGIRRGHTRRRRANMCPLVVISVQRLPGCDHPGAGKIAVLKWCVPAAAGLRSRRCRRGHSRGAVAGRRAGGGDTPVWFEAAVSRPCFEWRVDAAGIHSSQWRRGPALVLAEIGVSPRLRLTTEDRDVRTGLQPREHRMAGRSGDTETAGTHQFQAASIVRVPCFKKRTNVSRIPCLVEFR